eukprot:m.136608 g.136608  ORF g.136608 m.136608 type:complete len:139 (+) comp9904_c1_seq2:1250-1666(+)
MPTQAMYEDSAWTELVSLFRRNNLVLHGLSLQSSLSTALQIGASVFKTRSCGSADDCNRNCPTCNSDLYTLAEDLQYAHHDNSQLVCRITGDLMNENNPPMMLPNGCVYGEKVRHALHGAPSDAVRNRILSYCFSRAP